MPASPFTFRRALILSATLLLVAALPAAHADALDDIQKSGVIKLGIMTDYPPFGTVGSDLKPQGYDIDLSVLLAKFFNARVEFVPVTAPSRVPAIQSGKAQIMFNIGRSEERALVVDFSQPYAPYYIGIYGSAGNPAKTLADLSGKSVAVTRGAIEDRILTRDAPAANLVRFEDNASTISAFMSGQSETMAIGNIVALSLKERGAPRPFEEKFIVMNSPVHAAVGKGETRLLEKLNAFFSSVKKDGSLNAISVKWLKQPLASNLQ
ncbi:MAG: transporter substrate-binding domain-containing protein [Polaromonas sp.]|nr:transporter substrate-binding domain-containing protein [Polaromonas sp.]